MKQIQILSDVKQIYKNLPEFWVILFIVSFTSLGFEITITRYFALIFSHHYIFLAISIAMFGFGIGGFLTSIFNLKEKDLSRILTLYGLSFFIPALLPSCFTMLLTHPIILSSVFFLPFLFSSIIISVYFKLYSSRAGFVYFYDLVGAGFGSLTSIFLLMIFNPINLIILYAILIFLLMIFVERRTLSSVIFIIIITVVFVSNLKLKFMDIPLTKIPATTGVKVMVQLLQKNENVRIEKTYWNPSFRTDVINYVNSPQTKAIFVDGGAPTIMFNAEKGFHNLIWLKNTINYLPFLFVSNEDFLSIGPGGGLDIILADLSGMKNIEAVEINPSIVRILDEYKDYNGNILNNPHLFLKISEGRNYLLKNNQLYDLIFLSLSLTNTTAKTGVPFAESYLHTCEAYIDYYQHLKETGMVALFCETHPFLLRSLLAMIIALNKSGINLFDTYKHLIVVSNFLPESPYKYLILFSRNEITDLRAAVIKWEILKRKLNVEFLPYLDEKMPLKYKSFEEIHKFIKKIETEENLNITPVVDEKPFFYDFSTTLPWPFVMLCIFALAFSLVLLLFVRRKSNFFLISNFYLLGAGFILIEITLIQKFIFFLGEPSTTFSVVLFSFLLSCGLGGLFAYRFNKTTVLLLLCALLILLFLAINTLLFSIFSWSNWLKIIITIVIIFMLGFLMGMPFPFLLTSLSNNICSDIGIIYGINGAMSVFGSALAMIVARTFGFKCNILVAALLYFLVFIIMQQTAIRRRQYSRTIKQQSPTLYLNVLLNILS